MQPEISLDFRLRRFMKRSPTNKFLFFFLFFLFSTASVSSALEMDCSSCHKASPHQESCPTCNSCHHAVIQTGANQNHHAGLCLDCHFSGAPDGRAPHDKIAPLSGDMSCSFCHNDYSIPLPRHPHNSATPMSCVQCHINPGVVKAADCLVCHKSGVPLYSGKLHVATSVINDPPSGCDTDFVLGGTGLNVTFRDYSTDAQGPETAKVYINWGDGTPLEIGALGAFFSHTYLNYGTYNVTKTVQDEHGFNCVTAVSVTRIATAPDVNAGKINISTILATGSCSKYTNTVSSAAHCAAVGGVWSSPAPSFIYTYSVKQSGLTKKTGTGSTGTLVQVTGLPNTTLDYTVHLIYPTGHTCTFVQGTSVQNGGTVTATDCK
jgi:hypothetical protein